jgi:mRNA interferase MazF
MSCSRNDVVLLPIPFTDLSSRKVRPAVIVGKNGSDLFLVPISSQLDNTDIPLCHWQAAGLNVACGLKAQIATVEDRLIIKVLGQLTAIDTDNLNRLLRGWLQL